MSVIRICRLTLSQTGCAVALVAASLVASCAMTSSSAAPAASPVATSDASPERVILQTYRLIGERHVNEPDFRKLSVETYRGFASADPSLSIEPGDKVFSLKRDGHEILTRPAPTDPVDGRAWGNMVADFFTASLAASPTLQQTDRNTLTKAAMVATTKQLDRNTRYADPEEARDNRFQRDGGGGIGITVEQMDNKKIMIRAVQDDAPAAKAGIKPGDQVLTIDGESMMDRTLSDVVHKLRGSVGTPVAMTLLRESEGRQVDASMKRGRIIPTTVMYERRGDVAVIHVLGFNTATTDTLIHALDKARAEIGRDMAGIIIDLRGNRGGLLDQAEGVAELFIGDGVIFSTRGRHPDSQRVYRSDTHDHVNNLPIVVLVNGNSASASEIVTAALQDRGRAVVVGTTSYGKGTVQTVVRLSNQGELVLTWSRLVAPSGYSWNELGIMPNVCTAKVGDVAKLNDTGVEANKDLLKRWHAERSPPEQEISDLRKICPPGDDMPGSDLDIADRILHSPELYAHAVRTGSIDQAAAH